MIDLKFLKQTYFYNALSSNKTSKETSNEASNKASNKTSNERSRRLSRNLYPLCLFAFFILTAPLQLSAREDKATAEGYEEALLENQQEESDPTSSNLIEPKPKLPPPGLYPKNILNLGEGDYFSNFAFIADKSTRTLTIWRNSRSQYELIAAYPFDMGKNSGNKLKLGDLKTPEGVYFFNKTYSKNELDFNEYGDRAFVMDYPNFFDRIDKKTGSGIWLHAIPPTKNLLRGSRGCLVLKNEDIEKVEPYVQIPTTPIIVEDKIEYSNKNELQSKKQALLGWLEQWRASWQSKSIDSYINFYHETFTSNKMTKEQWYEYKSHLNKKYEYINVKLFSPVIYQHKDKLVVRFLQKYQSDGLTDFGEKTLYVYKDPSSGYKIIGEDWAPTSNEVVAKYEKCQNQGC